MVLVIADETSVQFSTLEGWGDRREGKLKKTALVGSVPAFLSATVVALGYSLCCPLNQWRISTVA